MSRVVSGSVVYRRKKYLMVVEKCGKLNLPIGGKENGESVVHCSKREGLEETGYELEPVALLGIYERIFDAEDDLTGFIFISIIVSGQPTFDNEVVGLKWLSYKQIREAAAKGKLKGNYVLKVIEDLRAGIRFPLSCIQTIRD